MRTRMCICSKIQFGLLALLLFNLTACKPANPDLDLEIHGPVSLGNEWLEVVPQRALKCERYSTEVVIWFATEYTTCGCCPGGIKFPDGSIVSPQVQLVSEDNEVFELREAGLSDTGMAFSRHGADDRPNLPRNKSFVKVRIRSDKPIECRQIVWRNYNPWDLK